MRYEWMMALLIPAEAREAAEQIGRQITSTPNTESASVYSLALSPSGDGPPTHFGCCTAANEAMLREMQTVLIANALPGVRYWRWSSEWGILAATNAPLSGSHLGEAWDWFRCLNDVGLCIVRASGWE